MTDFDELPEGTKMAVRPGQKAREDALLVALASGASIAEAARQAAMSPRTVHRRLRDSAFRQELAQVRLRLVDSALAKLVGSLGSAAETLRNLLSADSDSIRLSAAKSVFETVCRLKELTEFEARLAALEERNVQKSK